PTVTFASPVLIPGVSATSQQDKELITVDRSGGPFEGRVYVAWSELDDSRPTARIVFARSLSTSPLVFSRTMALSSSDALNQGAMPAVGPDGELYVVWGRFVWSGTSVASESIRLLKSIDGGISFTNPDSAD